MAINSSTNYHACIDEEFEAPMIVIMLLAMPFHLFIIKILAMEFQFDLPRHKILFSLSLSDAMMLFGVFIFAIVNKVVTVTTESTGCVVYRGFSLFIVCSTLVVSSTSIIALSVERYIACVHSFRLQQIFTESRVKKFAIFEWSLGCFLGFLVAFTNRYDGEAQLVSNYTSTQYVYIIFIIPTSVAATVIQVRLFIFSWKKMSKVNPSGAFGEQLELADFRKRQFKVAFMAGIVAFAYVFCMTPIAVVFLYELLSGTYVSLLCRRISFSMLVSNGLADPFIYGFGMADTRKKIIRDLKKLKQRLLEILPYSA